MANTSKPKPATKSSGWSPFVLKVKDGDKWKVLGYINMKPDFSSGIATLIREDGTKLEKVSVFKNEKKEDKSASGEGAAA